MTKKQRQARLATLATQNDVIWTALLAKLDVLKTNHVEMEKLAREAIAAMPDAPSPRNGRAKAKAPVMAEA